MAEDPAFGRSPSASSVISGPAPAGKRVGKDTHLRAIRDLALAHPGGDHVGEQTRVALRQNHLGFRRSNGATEIAAP
jgi:hypothetical protein